MYKISGKVLVKESRAGIPDLQVVLYDIDNRENIDPKLQEIFSADSKPDAVKNFFWEALPGNRLGSVLTNEKGEFQLDFNAEDFAAPEKINKPDLVLFVMAPEEPELDANNKITMLAKSSVTRILFYSYDPVVNSGKKEEYIIRIPLAVLAKHEINVYKSPANTNTSASIKESLNKSYQFSKEVKAAFKEEVNERIKKGIDIKRLTDTALQKFSLSKVAPEIRNSNSYLNANEKIKDKLKKVVDDTLKELPVKDASAKRKVVLNLTEEEARNLGITINDGGAGEVEIGKLLDHLGAGISGGTLESILPSLKACTSENKAKKLFEKAMAKCKNNGEVVEDPGGNGGASQPTAFSLEEQINRQMQFATPPEQELSYGIKRDGEIIATITKPGPTDNIAYHDFHSLEIAFENIWTEAFDPSLAASVGRVVSEMVRYANRISGTNELPEITDVNDMRELYLNFLNLREIIEDGVEDEVIVPPMPYKIRDYLPELTDYYWRQMNMDEQSQLATIIFELVKRNAAWQQYNDETDEAVRNPANIGYWSRRNEFIESQRNDTEKARELLSAAVLRIQEVGVTPGIEPRAGRRMEPVLSTRLKELMTELDTRLSEPHKFDIFAPNSMNFGLMFTYRQTWIPKDYQVGELVSTLPLAPKEVRKYTTKKIFKKTRTQKIIEDNQSSRSSESASTSRADSEIVKQAKNNTSFEQTANVNLTVGVIEGEFGTRFGMQAEKTSSDTKKNFREAVLKSAEEYKNQVRLEIETATSTESESTTSGEIMNPNEEITVTYLFYELQRQYQISEKLHQLTPVILVANEVPSPDQIDADWLIAHDWILRRVILDESFLPALQYVTTSVAGDELALQIFKDNVDRQVKLVEALTKQVEAKTEIAKGSFDELKRLMTFANSNEDLDRMKEISLAIALGPIALIGGGDDHLAEKREEVAKMALERSDKNVQEVNARLATEIGELRESIKKYTSALQEHLDRQTDIARLCIHIKGNFLYYMQYIWDFEQPDHRYFRLYNLDVPWINIDAPTRTVSISRVGGGTGGGSLIFPEASPVTTYHATLPIVYNELITTNRKLHEVADLDNLLGFRGNYMIFPMKVNSYLHTYMMQDYIDANTGGLRDPNEGGNYTTDELLAHLCCLQKKNPEEFERNKEAILNEFIKLQAKPHAESDLIVVPSGSLYIEALPGKHPILEDFKLVHRALDVKKVQAEVRHNELENIRLASRLEQGEREDPDIDKKIVVEGTDVNLINPPEA